LLRARLLLLYAPESTRCTSGRSCVSSLSSGTRCNEKTRTLKETPAAGVEICQVRWDGKREGGITRWKLFSIHQAAVCALFCNQIRRKILTLLNREERRISCVEQIGKYVQLRRTHHQFLCCVMPRNWNDKERASAEEDDRCRNSAPEKFNNYSFSHIIPPGKH